MYRSSTDHNVLRIQGPPNLGTVFFYLLAKKVNEMKSVGFPANISVGYTLTAVACFLGKSLNLLS